MKSFELLYAQFDEELLKKQQAAYSVAGVDEEVCSSQRLFN